VNFKVYFKLFNLNYVLKRNNEEEIRISTKLQEIGLKIVQVESFKCIVHIVYDFQSVIFHLISVLNQVRFAQRTVIF
jgi:hypothetical protein